MRIVRLEIFGFKSFMERFVLNFDEKLIGVVGPNGCGKSNIVDALRWVLGETSAKRLRGTVLDDVIFNGSESRRPLGMAEVSITIRPEDNWQQQILEYEQQKPLKLPEPTDLLEANSDEDVEKEDAEQDLEQAINQEPPAEEEPIPFSLTALFQAVPGLHDAAEIQLCRRLYRSGESEYFINRVPCRLRDMSDLYRAIGLGPRGLSIVQQGQIGEFISKKPQERRKLLEEAAGISGFRVKMEAAQRKLERTTNNMARLVDIITEVEKQVTVLRRQAKRARNRGELKEALLSSDLELFNAKATKLIVAKREFSEQSKDSALSLELAKDKLAAMEEGEQESRAELEQHESQLADLRAQFESTDTALTELYTKRHSARVTLAESEGKLQSIQESLRFLDERKENIGVEIERKNIAKSEVAEKLEQVVASISGLVEDKELKSEVAELQQRKQDLSNEVNRCKIQRASLESEINSLNMQLSALKELSNEPDDSQSTDSTFVQSLSNNGAKRLVASINTPEHLEKAVAAVLRDRGNYYLTDSIANTLGQYSEQLELNKQQVGLVERRTSDVDEAISLEEKAKDNLGATLLLDSLVIDERVKETVSSLIGRVCLVDDRTQALALLTQARALNVSIEVVTLDGELFTPETWTCSKQKGTLYSFPRILAAKQKETAKLAERIQNDEVSLEKLSSEYGVKSRALEEATESLTTQRNELFGERASFIERLRSNDEQVEVLRTELRSLENRREALVAEQRELSRLTNELEDSLSEATLEAEEERETELAERKQQLLEDAKTLEATRDECRSNLAALMDTINQLRRDRDQFGETHSEVKLKIERFDIELSLLLEDIQQKSNNEVELPLEADVENIMVKANHDIEAYVSSVQQEVERLRRRLEREGEVDPESIEMYETEDKRLQDMKTQHADLEAATVTLERTIRQLKEISRARFLDTFEFVNNKFQELVPRLFGGGAGYMELINPEDPLSSGVELSVRPPGKKLRSMELLSGGEKALSAVATLMSMFLYRPSPICVLDEVDAPLDDANLARFLDLVSEISSRTQFLLITHNRQSMVEMSKLIGITMEEKGVSKALSVTLEEAERTLEQVAVNQ